MIENGEELMTYLIKHAKELPDVLFLDLNMPRKNGSECFTYAQIIDGSAIIEIDGKATMLQTGEGIIIPAHKPSQIKPNGRFKLLLTVIKSGYE